jgi:hypothetical protein
METSSLQKDALVRHPQMMASTTPTDACIPLEYDDTRDQHAGQNRNSKPYVICAACVLGMMLGTIGLLSVQHYGLGDTSFTKFFFAPTVPLVRPSSVGRNAPIMPARIRHAKRSVMMRAGAGASVPVVTEEQLGDSQVTPLVDGRVKGATIKLSSLWKDTGAVIFAVRRPG